MDFLTKITNWFESTHLQEQVKDVDLALFSNPWFIVPFACLIIYLLYKQSWKDLIIITVLIDWAPGLCRVRAVGKMSSKRNNAQSSSIRAS